MRRIHHTLCYEKNKFFHFIVALYGDAMCTDFPPEPTQELIRDRAATAEDCAAGRAAFAASVPSPDLANEPLDVFLPRVASVRLENGDISTVVLIQAEVARVPENLVVLGYEDSNGNLVSPAAIPALNSRCMLCEPLTHFLIRPRPLERMSVAMIVFRPRGQDVSLELLLAFPRAAFQIIVFERMDEDLGLV